MAPAPAPADRRPTDTFPETGAAAVPGPGLPPRPVARPLRGDHGRCERRQDIRPALSEQGASSDGGDGPAAAVTAAGKGIGAARARKLARRGYRLTIMARSDSIQDVAAGVGADAVQGTSTKVEDPVRLVDRAMTSHDRVDAVVANTGLSRDRGDCDGKFFDIGEREASSTTTTSTGATCSTCSSRTSSVWRDS